MHYVFIVNARQDKAYVLEKVNGMISACTRPLDYEIYLTEHPGSATAFIRNYCNSHQDEETCFIACGGDGTINETASGLPGTHNKHMSVIALGTGNDFVKYYKGIKFDSIEGILDGTAENIDIIKVDDRYSVNVCNFGFDAVVCSVANRMSRRGVKNSYRWAIVNAIFTARYNRISVTADGERLDHGNMLLCTLANNHYVGGEFFCAPRSKNNDGLIDLCIIKSITLAKFLSILGIYTRGEHLDNPKLGKILKYRQVKHVDIESEKAIELCLDGEMYPGHKFSVDILPGAISFIVPKN